MDHYLVLGCLHDANPRELQCYLGTSTRIPIRPHRQPPRKDNLLVSLHNAVPKPPAREFPHNYWISEETWKVIGTRVSLGCALDRDQHCIHD